MNENTTPQTEEKTFSQDDVNRIISERLTKEKAKADAAIVQREQELAQRELLLTAKEKLIEKGLSLDLLDALNTSTPEALENSISVITRELSKNKTSPQEIKGAKPAQPGIPPHNNRDADVRFAFGLKE